MQRRLGALSAVEVPDSLVCSGVVYGGLCEDWSGRREEARQAFLRVIQWIKPTPETVVPPDGEGRPSILALAYAGLGDKNAALQQAARAVAEYDNDAVNKPAAEAVLAQIQAKFGDIESAIAAIPHLLKVPAGINVADLRFNPLWDPLRKDPRFRETLPGQATVNPMSAESSSDIKFEIGHVLFIDIVGYSKLLITEQSEQLDVLKKIVRGTEQFRLAEAERRLLRLPTGDGGALVFRTNPEAPVLCASEISKELTKHPGLHVRMGIHSGPVNEITDLNEQANIAGAGINMAQRIMDCGDAGHILLSKHVADDLEQYPRWRSFLHQLGECEVKHGVRVDVINFYGDGIGNAQVPRRFQVLKKRRAQMRWAAIAAALLLLVGVIAASVFVSKKSAISISTAPEKSIAVLPFENLSEDKSNAFFADGVQDEILTDLAKVADLKVISRTSVMQYRDKAARNLREIAQQLGVAHVLEGTVQRVADKVRVNTQLINARTDAHEWAENYDRPINDVFAIQSEIAKTIAEQLRARLSPSEKAEIAKPSTNDPVAYDLYLRARQLDDLSNDPDAKGQLTSGN